MTFKDVEHYSDMVFAEHFEGYPAKVNFTTDEWADVAIQLKASLHNVYTDYARLLDTSHQSRGALKDIMGVAYGNSTDTPPKYKLYSAHDSNIAAWLDVLEPAYQWQGIRYAANIQFEVYFKKNTTERDVMIVTRYNGRPLSLEGCESNICSADKFFEHMNKFRYQGDLKEACAKDPTKEYLHFLKTQDKKKIDYVKTMNAFK